MFTPEFVNEERGEYVLVSNHGLESTESVELSLSYNRARILAGRPHLPARIRTCRIVYDVRGQTVPDETIAQIRLLLSDLALVEFMR
ncbi:hypothetical protein GO285_01456 [Ralstonia solanacearum]|nr:hypothetical protein [Ralstonia solanacearum]NKG09659.1 hypothetical protein [Ralstonia solanacearum]